MIITIKKIPTGLRDNKCIIKTSTQVLYVPTRFYDVLVKVYYQTPRAKRYECIETIQLSQYTFDLSKTQWEEIKPLYHQCTERR